MGVVEVYAGYPEYQSVRDLALESVADACEALWMTVQQVSQPIPSDHKMVAFYCETGRHQSYALLIAFLMWSSHIHEPQIWEAIISPLRNAHGAGQPLRVDPRGKPH
jgi:hypothetical protein